MSTESESKVTWFNADTALRDEANAVHKGSAIGDIAADKTGKALYRELHRRAANALCLSGGGIRSATFALGVVEALAAHPRPKPDRPVESETKSLLRQFHYLSSVSGGGYIASWLSAWITRDGFGEVWRNLIGRRDNPDQQPGALSWLRAYSNYLTPRLGLFSADTWTAVALYIRNLVLNWLVILPALILLLLAIKAFAVVGLWSAASVIGLGRPAVVGFALLGVILLMYAHKSALQNRPSAFLGPKVEPRKRKESASSNSAYRNEKAHVAEGADDARFLKRCLLPALAASYLLALYLVARGPKLTGWSLPRVEIVAILAGVGIYALSWLWAWPPGKHRTGGKAARLHWLRDFYSWAIAGAVYGALIGAGIYILAQYDLWFVIGNVNTPSAAGHVVATWPGYFLIALIYGVPWIIIAQTSAEMIFVGLTNWQPYSDADREWFGRSAGYFTILAAMWFAIGFLVLIAGELALALLKSNTAKILSALSAAGTALFSTLMGKSGKSSATEDKDKSGLAMRIALPLSAVLFLIMLVLAISYVLDHLLFGESLIYSSLLMAGPRSEIRDELLWLVAAIVILGVVAAVAWTHVNINRFSIHAIYRNRLIRGYLGASNANREPNPFTGFDEADNIAMAQLWPPEAGQWRPFHVVNIALNVVNSKRLAWQERKAEAFTATPLHCGTAELGYRRTQEYGNSTRGGMSLGTALAISGAAASPNMGYHSSPIVSLLLALFNVRLGWWLGNPGPCGAPDYYKSDGPRVAIKPFIGEMFGLTTDDRPYVYLSDGGHFENLGLYEMIRRRCRCIVISDAACDPDYGFGDLGNAVRKIAIDLGVDIAFGTLHELKRRSKDGSVIKGAYYAVGKIDYKNAPEWSAGAPPGEAAEEGYILYVKPGYHGTESAGIVAYAAANAPFPHEITADQFFSESQFESYRRLGFEIMDGVLTEAGKNVETIRNAGKADLDPGRLPDLLRALEPKLIADAEGFFAPPPIRSPSDGVKTLDKDDIVLLRSIFNPPPEPEGTA